MNKESVFSQFTQKYALSKTLRFELKPVGKTLENMHKNLGYDEKLKTFLSDQNIENAYQSLKPVLDFLHEQFISQSLESDAVKNIDFSEYLSLYIRRKDLKNKDFELVEKNLRNYFSKAYREAADKLKEKAGKNSKGKDVLGETGYKVLTEKGVLEYIKKNINDFIEIKSKEEIENAIKVFESFFTYFGGFNQNRENYYETGKEASTAVASRVVHENLPKFCDNILFFENRSMEYEEIYNFLEKSGKSLVNKDNTALRPITEYIFTINHFNSCLSQAQIEKYNDQIANANFLVNLYNQAKKDEPKFSKLQFFKTLYKQIGCGKRDSLFFALSCDRKNEIKKVDIKTDNQISSVEEVLELAAIAGKKYFNKIEDSETATVQKFIDDLLARENYSGIYWSKTAMNTISNRYFANWHDIKDRLKVAKVFKKADKDSGEEVSTPLAIELSELFKVLDQIDNWQKNLFKSNFTEDDSKKEIIDSSVVASQALMRFILKDLENHAQAFLDQSEETLIIEDYKKNSLKIKSWLENALSVSQILKYFQVRETKIKGSPLDSVVSKNLDALLRSDDADWFKWYDSIRNYLTKKPSDDLKANKLKLNFENSSLAAGWDVNKEIDNYCVIIKGPNGQQFLSVIAKQKDSKGFNKIFVKSESNQIYKQVDRDWKKMEYKLLPSPNKMLPKCLLPKSNRSKYGASKEILDIYDSGSFKKNEANFSVSSLRKLIDFYKEALQKYEDWKCFNFVFKPTEEYEDISKFYNDVEKQGYNLNFVDINKATIDDLVDQGKIYLFQIKNQDYNQSKKENHQNNLHTIYWRAIFENVNNKPKLNGEAEIFYRKAISSEKLERIKDKNGKEIIKNFRFSKEKFLFHVPITLNFCFKNNKINNLVNESLINDNAHFLGIDRGEKHLAYYSLVDSNGLIKDQDTLNILFSKPIKAKKKIIDKDGNESEKEAECNDYNDLLDARAGNRDYARKNWQTIGTIKELKDGYISQVVKKVVDLSILNDAFIVLEDLNTGFKRGRQKIEKSVYQKMELALAKKLNFLVDKSSALGEIGSVTNALQLTPPVSNYSDIENRKQLGVMLYARANYTSQTDPATGWRKTIYLKKASEEKIKKQIIESFTDILFDGKDYHFVYTNKNTGKKWNLYSSKNGKNLDRFHGERDNDKNTWVSTKQDLVKMLDGLFINFDKNRSLHSQLVEEGVQLVKISKHSAWESLRFVVELIQQIRNSGEGKVDSDFILSPVRNERGEHFDSRAAGKDMPSSGDANGAYNIARKGIIMSEHIKRDLSLYISDEEWDAWLAGKEVWEKWLKNHPETNKK